MPMAEARSSRQVAALMLAVLLFYGGVGGGQGVDRGGYRPHYQGYGVNTPGGRGGEVCRVTSLDDGVWPPAPGTIRYCVEASTGPRFVIFETSGTIRLDQGPLYIRSPYITIAGQTAPSPGILIRGPGVIVDTHDVVLQHMRIRVGSLPYEPHSLWLRDDARNVVIDHVSLSWAVWTSLGISSAEPVRAPGNITILDSIVSESLGCSGVNNVIPCDPRWYPTIGHSNSRAIGIAPPSEVTLLRNILAHNNDRHPEIGGPSRTLIVNNLIYNPSQAVIGAIFFQDVRGDGPTLSVVHGNLLIAGPTTPGHRGFVSPEYPAEGDVRLVKVHPSLHPNSQIFLNGNYYAKDCQGLTCLASPASQWLLAADGAGESVHALEAPLELDNLPLSSALAYTDVERFVTANAGARPRDRDAVDTRIIREIAMRSGSVPNTPAEKAGTGTEADGFPILAVNRRMLRPPTNPHSVVDSAGRTRIEAWLETYARALEPALARR
jgi:hypothetical protein